MKNLIVTICLVCLVGNVGAALVNVIEDVPSIPSAGGGGSSSSSGYDFNISGFSIPYVEYTDYSFGSEGLRMWSNFRNEPDDRGESWSYLGFDLGQGYQGKNYSLVDHTMSLTQSEYVSQDSAEQGVYPGMQSFDIQVNWIFDVVDTAPNPSSSSLRKERRVEESGLWMRLESRTENKNYYESLWLGEDDQGNDTWENQEFFTSDWEGSFNFQAEFGENDLQSLLLIDDLSLDDSFSNDGETLILSGSFQGRIYDVSAIPEPATMFLLGIGGLFLRKKGGSE